MNRAYEREVEMLEADLADGSITMTEFNKAMRDLNMELRESAREVAENTYNDFIDSY
jgi:hypothetical protein